MGRTVILRHDLPDGSHHFDWLIERPPPPAAPPPDPDDRTLIAWRLGSPLAERDLAALRLPDHRRLYLDYEGPISGARGSVIRIAAGSAEIHADDAQRFDATLLLDGVPRRVRGRAIADSRWRLTLT